jgi:multidrug efflux pump subunit AcrB
MLFETSRQARFLIPMAISLAFGVLFSTFIILYLIPVLYIILEDIMAVMGKVQERIGRKRGIV